ncbi:MAG: Veg family protein [Clostridia bacterium]|nr:Veg family protein [Clostridia bacterium]
MMNLLEVKEKVLGLKGKDIDLAVNKGRNKIVKLRAVITEVYPSMFVISPVTNVDLDRKSYSYNDILCGDVRFI